MTWEAVEAVRERIPKQLMLLSTRSDPEAEKQSQITVRSSHSTVIVVAICFVMMLMNVTHK